MDAQRYHEARILWLIYEYEGFNDEFDWDPPVSLSEVYKNWYNSLQRVKDAELSQDLSRGYLELGKPWDVVQVFKDIDDWHPEDPEHSKPQFAMMELLGPSLRTCYMEPLPEKYFR